MDCAKRNKICSSELENNFDGEVTQRRNAAPPKVSVIMPVYNEERYLGEAISSILSQTFSAYELIIPLILS